MGGRLWLAALATSVCGVWLGCTAPGAFACETNSQCGEGGTCQPSGFCSFADSDCDSGQAYGDAAPSGLAGECVPVQDDTGGATSGPDPSSGDGGGDGTMTGSADDEGSGDTLALTSGASTSEGSSTSGPPNGDSSSGDGSGSGSSGEPMTRVIDGLLVLYDFSMATGETIDDLSGVDPPMPLTVQTVGDSPFWTADGLVFSGDGIAAVEGSSSKVRLGLQDTNTMTVEAWVTPSELVQEGPTRIATLSLDHTERAFTLGHGGAMENPKTMLGFGDSYLMRLRTTDTEGLNGIPSLISDPVVQLQPTHVVATHDEASQMAVWVDGVLVGSETRTGTYDEWAAEYVFAVGNEINLGRPYLGTIHLVAVYDRALAPDEIQQNLDAGF